MKRFLTLGTLTAIVLLAGGCEVFSGTGSSVREKFALRDQPRTHHYSTDPRVTYDAGRKAADQMGYRFVRGGPAQGELEAISGLATNDKLSSSRQVSMSIKLAASPDGGTDLSLLFKEIIEGDSVRRAGQVTTTTLLDTPQYEVFFRTVQQVLDGGKK